MNRDGGKLLKEKPVVVIRRKVGPKSTPTGPTQATPKTASSVMKVAKPANPPQPPQQLQQPVPPQTPATPAITKMGPSKKEQETHACRELLDVIRQRWPQTFPQDFKQLKPWAIGMRHALIAHLPEHPPRRVGAAIGMYKRFMGPVYFRALLQGGPRYDLEGNPCGEVTPEEQEHAKQDLAAFYEQRKKRAASSNPHPRRDSSAEGRDGAGKGD
jgi:ProP effector